MFDTILDRLGNPAYGNYSDLCFERWGCFVRRAVSASFLKQLPMDDSLVEIAQALVDKEVFYMETCVMKPPAVSRVI